MSGDGGIDWSDLVLGPLQGVFGEAVTYTPAGKQPIQITGVFDEAYTGLMPSGAGGLNPLGMPNDITEVTPILGVQLSQLPVMPEQDDGLVVRGQSFLVKQVEVDGKGGAKLTLNEAP